MLCALPSLNPGNTSRVQIHIPSKDVREFHDRVVSKVGRLPVEKQRLFDAREHARVTGLRFCFDDFELGRMVRDVNVHRAPIVDLANYPLHLTIIIGVNHSHLSGYHPVEVLRGSANFGYAMRILLRETLTSENQLHVVAWCDRDACPVATAVAGDGFCLAEVCQRAWVERNAMARDVEWLHGGLVSAPASLRATYAVPSPLSPVGPMSM